MIGVPVALAIGSVSAVAAGPAPKAAAPVVSNSTADLPESTVAETSTAAEPAAAAEPATATDQPGVGHEDPAGANVDYQFNGEQ
ncbi:MAG TPA: hypothetical protein VET65_05660 [Candidatus Limnocylindrales bacterium]|nr:hypothetical protein [Candidatus Limnocylindrales bacterium]